MTSGLFAQEEGPAAPSNGNQGLTQTLVMIGVALFFFYFIMWRPEQKRRKEMTDQRDSMKKGDRVTAMGIVGTISKVNEETVILSMIDGSKIEMLKAAISDVESSGSSQSGSKTVEINAK
jgi:preprotein translocase subunit YajC